MARDIVALMDTLGLKRANLLGHDRGARVTYRTALDHPDRVDRIGIIEIVATGDFWDAWNAELALAAYHWTFLAQPAPLPERMIGADPEAYVEWTLASWTRERSLSIFAEAALEGYRAQVRDAARIAAMCADYRAGVTTDREADAADRRIGHRIAAPLMFLYAADGFPSHTGKPGALWRAWGEDVATATCESGHFVPEENPQAVLDTFLPFFLAQGD
jgi:haloacetate dehalogenase